MYEIRMRLGYICKCTVYYHFRILTKGMIYFINISIKFISLKIYTYFFMF